MSEPDFSNVRFTDGGGGPLEDKPPAPPKLRPETPKPGPPPRRSAPKSAAPPVSDGELKESVDGFIMLIALPMMMFDNHPDGTSCAQIYVTIGPKGFELTPEANAFSAALTNVAEDNRYLKAFFGAGDTLGKWAALAVATQPLAVAMMNNHARQEAIQNDFGNSPMA